MDLFIYHQNVNMEEIFTADVVKEYLLLQSQFSIAVF